MNSSLSFPKEDAMGAALDAYAHFGHHLPEQERNKPVGQT